MGAMQVPRAHSRVKEKLRTEWGRTKKDFKTASPLDEKLQKKDFKNAGTLIEKLRNKVLSRAFVSDTASGFTFSMTVCMPIEMGIAGMTFDQSWHARLASIPCNLGLSGLYGIFRDWTFRITKTGPESSQVKKFLVDLGTFLVGQLPFYGMIVAASGASFKQVLISCGSMVIASPLFGRPLGAWYDFVRRRIFHIAPAGASAYGIKDADQELPFPGPES